MEELIENKHWSAEENQNLQSIIIAMKLTQHQKSVLNEQIQKFQSSEKFLQHLLDNFNNWDKLQECIMKEISKPTEIEQEWTQQELLNFQYKLQQQIQSEEEIKGLIQGGQLQIYQIIIQFYQSCLNRKIIEKATKYKFKSADQFIQLVGIIFEQSEIKSTQELNTVQPNSEQTVNDLFKEFNSLNQVSNDQLQNLLQLVYSSLENQKDLDLHFINFTSSPELLFEDLIFLCLKTSLIIVSYIIIQPKSLDFQNFCNSARSLLFKILINYLKPLFSSIGLLLAGRIKFIERLEIYLFKLYNHNQNKGRLAQIYTGEGKTLIIAMLAILLNQKKKSNVDVVTSSPVLATRDAEQFYNSFSVKVSHNISGSKNYAEGMLPCYNSTVIYGDPHSFQADILRHEYSERGTMGNRKQEFIIVDEVDSMLIDGNSDKTLLSSPIPGMLDLTKVLRLIWDEICKQNQIYQQKNNVDLKEYIESALNLQLNEVLHQFIPKFRLNYIEFMKKTWIENAIHAKYNLHEDYHYKIENNNVRIIDYQNTGVIHGNNMHWEKGLHQFVQLKHNLPISPLTINTNYLSNVTFFKRYKTKILGFTGTLGSQVTQNLLAKYYCNIDIHLQFLLGF